MKTNEIYTKEYLYLIYAYSSMSTFTMLSISKITESLGKALNFSPIVSILIVLNMIFFISLYVYRIKHTANYK
jgi:hypothetical protein